MHGSVYSSLSKRYQKDPVHPLFADGQVQTLPFFHFRRSCILVLSLCFFFFFFLLPALLPLPPLLPPPPPRALVIMLAIVHLYSYDYMYVHGSSTRYFNTLLLLSRPFFFFFFHILASFSLRYLPFNSLLFLL